MTPMFSVVAVTRDQRWTLPALLRCLDNQTLSPALFECIFVDDGSTDGTRALLETHTSRLSIRVVAHDVRMGAAYSRNVGYRGSSGRIVVFLDADALPAPDWLAGYREAFASSSDRVVSGRRVGIRSAGTDRGGELAALAGVPVGALFDRERAADDHGRICSRATPGDPALAVAGALEVGVREICATEPRSLLAAASVFASNVAVPRQLLDQTAGFAAAMQRFDDWELGLQLWEAGASFAYSDRACCCIVRSEGPAPPTFEDLLALFYRHPYGRLIELMCWLIRGDEPLPALLTRQLSSDQLAASVSALYGQKLPLDCQFGVDEMLDLLCEEVGRRDARGPLERILNEALSAGIAVGGPPARPRLDRYHTLNFIDTCTTYKELALRQSYIRANRTPLQAQHAGAAPLVVRISGAYEVLVSAGAMALAGADACISLPLPVDCAAQQGVRVGGFAPRELEHYVDLSRGRIASFPLATFAGEPISLRYEFECEVREIAGVTAGSHSAADLKATLPASHRQRAAQLIRTILAANQFDGTPAAEPRAVARAIYLWLLEHALHRAANASNTMIFDIGLGPCFQHARAFVQLCRLVGIPAREQSGAILGLVGAHGSAVMTARGHSPFHHTWAEFHDGDGWCPVEFFGRSCGKRILTSRNVVDATLRREVGEQTAAYDNYYFGCLDPYRVHVARDASRLMTCPMGRSAAWLEAYEAILWATRHRIDCSIRA